MDEDEKWLMSTPWSPVGWRIIPVSKWLVTPNDRPLGRVTTLFRGLTITMVINHLLTGMILQVGCQWVMQRKIMANLVMQCFYFCAGKYDFLG